MEYISVKEAIDRPGMRLVLSAGVPGPWGEAAKAMLNHKGVEWVAVFQEGGGENDALLQWTGQNSAPVAVYEDLPPACHWLDLLMLLERVYPQQPLLPEDQAVRAQVIGLCALIAGAEGFGWQRRLHMLEPMMKLDPVPDVTQRLARKYGYSDAAFNRSVGTLEQICQLLDEQLAAQEEQGSPYFIGQAPTAVDFYWPGFSGMIKPLPHEDNPLPKWMRPVYEASDPAVIACLTPRLEAHRDRMYQRHIPLPLDY